MQADAHPGLLGHRHHGPQEVLVRRPQLPGADAARLGHRGRPPHGGVVVAAGPGPAAQRNVVELQELDDRLGGRWDEPLAAALRQPDVVRVHTFDVLLRRDVVDELTLVELSRERRQQQDAVDGGVTAGAVELRADRLFGGVAME